MHSKTEAENTFCPCYREQLLHSFIKGPFLTDKDTWSDYSNVFMTRTADPPFISLKYKITTYPWEFSCSQKAGMAPKAKLRHSKNILAEFIHLYFLKKERNFKGIKKKETRSWVNSVVLLKAFFEIAITVWGPDTGKHCTLSSLIHWVWCQEIACSVLAGQGYPLEFRLVFTQHVTSVWTKSGTNKHLENRK